MRARPVLLLLAVVGLVAISACAKPAEEPSSAEKIPTLAPAEVVRLYYESWNNKDYAAMYALISDGFKELEPTAKDLVSFAAEMGKFYEEGTGITVQEVNEINNDGQTATVDYTVVLQLQGGSKTFRSTYTLKKRAGGWKMIHPYGEHVDTS